MTTGRCLCGAIQFEFAGEAVETTHCHCESCRRQTSSPVATFVTVHDSTLRITRGQPNETPRRRVSVALSVAHVVRRSPIDRSVTPASWTYSPGR